MRLITAFIFINRNKHNYTVMKTKVIVECMEDNLWHLYNEAGQIEEGDFETKEAAKEFAVQNDYEIVNSFFI